MSEKEYSHFYLHEGKYLPTGTEVNSVKALPPGCYQYHSNTKNEWFTPFELKFDEILDLPSPEYSFVTQQFSHFLTPKVKQQFKDFKFLYKRSVLLYGAWGTGKSIITNRIAEECVKKYNGIVLFATDATDVRNTIKIIEQTQPETPLVVILEELDEILKAEERQMLVILDGAVQKNNIMFLATTNHIDKIPKRVLRPGRFSLVVEIKYPNEEARRMYFESKLGKNHERIGLYTLNTSGLSIDELKEVLISCEIFEQNLSETVSRILTTRESNNTNNSYNEDYSDDCEEEEYHGN